MEQGHSSRYEEHGDASLTLVDRGGQVTLPVDVDLPVLEHWARDRDLLPEDFREDRERLLSVEVFQEGCEEVLLGECVVGKYGQDPALGNRCARGNSAGESRIVFQPEESVLGEARRDDL